MTKKDYELIASMIRYCKEHYTEPNKAVIDATLECLAGKLSEKLLEDNEKFDSDRFMSTCGFDFYD